MNQKAVSDLLREDEGQEQIVMMSPRNIKPYPNNPRVNDDAVEKVANSISEFGFRSPIIVDKDMVIIAGHTRLKAAKSLGLKEVPVLIAGNLSEEQAKAYRLADNKTAELAYWDDDLLADELSEIYDIDMADFGFDLMGDDLEEGEDGEIEEVDVPEAPEEPVAKRGDIWKLGKHRLMCGDSTSKQDVQRLMENGKAGMVFTDPPWNVDYGGSPNNGAWKQRSILNDHMSTEDFKKFMSDVFARMHDSIVPGGMVYVVMSAQEWGNMMLELKEHGFHWSSTIIWNKDSLVLSRKDYHTRYEPIWYGWEDSAPRVHPLEDRKQCDVWDIPRPKKSDEHPTMKPVALVAQAIMNSSSKGDVVLDLFGGSGTTLIASEQTGRACRMMELDPKYVDVIVKRWEALTGETAELVTEEEDDDEE